MRGLPDISFEGTVATDVNIRPAGQTVVGQFRCAVTEQRREKGTGKVTDGATSFLTVIVWAKLAEHLAQSVTVGDRVVVLGSIKQREFTTDKGEKRTVYEVTADSIGPAVTFEAVPTTRMREGGPDTGAGAAAAW